MSIPEARLRCGETVAVVSASGASIRSLRWAGRPLLREFPEGAHPPEATNITLAPWPNRVAGAAFEFAGRKHRLAVTEPERGHALHGFSPGTIFDLEAGTANAELRAVLGPREGWPWPIEVRVKYTAREWGIKAEIVARNLADRPAPCALGAHPYLDPLGWPLDECIMHLGAARRLPLNAAMIPDSALEPNWPQPSVPMRGRCFDDVFYQGNSPHEVRLVHPSGEGVCLRSSLPWTQIYTSPRRWLAVEPMTAPPNALNSRVDLRVLAPGESLSAHYSIARI
ncbi:MULTISPECIES: hypothetical protein [unclassified Corynebacterium]|uniref:aldose epimerase family protein n=1 Tax=unclassified Corynebacterium TaxID=2624378 RepID=UPI0029CA96F5|nr:MULTISPECIES: hypothetical protein [unclassified Corynebacterium]WPF67117.1 hypothetical protein OLX12_05225 [Corynebacterium sp. 22KM0430]WPF69605.1 hypothetical protein OLW90_05220 [Corynebacterium sp. 21KM1197]